MASTPTLTPPIGGDVILSNRYIAGITAMTILAVSTAWLRMYTRIFVSHNTGWDDWTMFAASVRWDFPFCMRFSGGKKLKEKQIVTVLTNAFLMSSYNYGLGRHMYYLKPEQILRTHKWLWAAEPTNLFAVFLVRLSISLFFLRLIPPRKIYVWTIWGTIAGLVISDVLVSINYFFQCRPIRKVWEPAAPGKCFSEGVAVWANCLYQGEVPQP